MEKDLEKIVMSRWAEDGGSTVEEREELAKGSREKWLEGGKDGEKIALFMQGVEKTEGDGMMKGYSYLV